jgi:hypothetical protein
MIAGWGNYVIVLALRRGNYMIVDTSSITVQVDPPLPMLDWPNASLNIPSLQPERELRYFLDSGPEFFAHHPLEYEVTVTYQDEKAGELTEQITINLGACRNLCWKNHPSKRSPSTLRR